MNKKYIVLVRLLRFIIIIFITVPVPKFAQQNILNDDPQYDHIPPEYFNSVGNHSETDAVISIDGWDNFNLGVDYAEPHMSVNPLNPLRYLNAWNINYTHYTQNGSEWFDYEPNFVVSPAGDPVTAYDSLGNLFYETMYGSISGCKVIRSTNNGQTWSAAVTAIAGNDKNWIACDQTSGPYANYVYTTMTPGNFARSTDHGATFQTTGTSTTFGGTQSLPGMMVAVGPNGNIPGGCVYVVTHSGTNGAGRYTFFRSTDGGATFSQRSQQFFSNYIGTEISGRSTVNGMRTRPYPMIAADNSWGPYRGRLYLVYASNMPAGSGNKADIFFRYSDDQAATWSGAVTVNDDPNTSANHNFFPSIWCDKQTGRLYIKWYDTRRCPTSDSMDVYATNTDNGGTSFAPNQRISNKTFKTKLSTTGTPPVYQGDYDAVSGINNQAMLVWTDFRNDNFGSYVAYFPDFAMLTSVSSLSVGTAGDTASFYISVPAVKLYNNTAEFTTEINPSPGAGQILITSSGSNILTTYPDSVKFIVKTVGWVPQGIYTITITGKGPNGTPVHKRTIILTVGPPEPYQLSVNIQAGWNVVSIPGLHPVNQNVTTWWSGKDPDAGVFRFSSGYQLVNTLEPGVGYWMKHIGARTYNTGDEWPAGGIMPVPHNSLAATGGWNLIGGYEHTVPASGITTTPPGLIAGPVYKYASGYQITTTIEPGYGYWVKLSDAGQINIPEPGDVSILKSYATDFGKIILTDYAQKNYTLYAANGEADFSKYDLPPLPPEGIFDIRYSSQRFAENINTPQGIEVRGAEFPVKIKAEGINIILSDESGSVTRLNEGEEITLGSITGKLIVSENKIPSVYSLGQNYPNPFNPVTSIQFSIPEEVSVKLSLYNLLGQRVSEIRNEVMEAGNYEIRFYAGNLAAGMYLYHLEAGVFRDTKKMMLVK